MISAKERMLTPAQTPNSPPMLEMISQTDILGDLRYSGGEYGLNLKKKEIYTTSSNSVTKVNIELGNIPLVSLVQLCRCDASPARLPQ